MAQAVVYEDAPIGWRNLLETDLPASGVTAATYGDGTHVGQFTVNAEGIITAASNVAVSGGSGTVTSVGSSDSSITVTNPTTTPNIVVATVDGGSA